MKYTVTGGLMQLNKFTRTCGVVLSNTSRNFQSRIAKSNSGFLWSEATPQEQSNFKIYQTSARHNPDSTNTNLQWVYRGAVDGKNWRGRSWSNWLESPRMSDVIPHKICQPVIKGERKGTSGCTGPGGLSLRSRRPGNNTFSRAKYVAEESINNSKMSIIVEAWQK